MALGHTHADVRSRIRLGGSWLCALAVLVGVLVMHGVWAGAHGEHGAGAQADVTVSHHLERVMPAPEELVGMIDSSSAPLDVVSACVAILAGVALLVVVLERREASGMDAPRRGGDALPVPRCTSRAPPSSVRLSMIGILLR